MIADCYRRKRPLPERIQNAPDLFMGLEIYFDAFTELNTCRQQGWGPGPIPAWCIQEHAISLGLTEEETEDLRYHIRMMDEAFLKHIARKGEKSA